MAEFDGRGANDQPEPLIKNYPGFGELTIGTSDKVKVIVTALCMLDDPNVNQYFLDNKLRLVDRITKTKIFPRNGMSLPEGEVYEEPAPKTTTESENAS